MVRQDLVTFIVALGAIVLIERFIQASARRSYSAKLASLANRLRCRRGRAKRFPRLPAEMATEKIDHRLELIITPGRVGEERVVPASLTVSGLDRLLVRAQGHREFMRQPNPCVLSKPIFGAMHNQDRQLTHDLLCQKCV